MATADRQLPSTVAGNTAQCQKQYSFVRSHSRPDRCRRECHRTIL